MHHMDANNILRENARWELHKNAVCYLEQILEATPHETTAVWPLLINFDWRQFFMKSKNRYWIKLCLNADDKKNLQINFK